MWVPVEELESERRVPGLGFGKLEGGMSFSGIRNTGQVCGGAGKEHNHRHRCFSYAEISDGKLWEQADMEVIKIEILVKAKRTHEISQGN